MSTHLFCTLSICLLSTLAHAGTSATNAPVKVPRAPNGLTFKSVLDLQQESSGIEPQLRGGTIANSRDWPASFYASYTSDGWTYGCTSVLVGPHALATAAHCVPENGSVQFTARNRTYAAQCAVHSAYGEDASADYGLCRLSAPFQAPAGFLYERFDLAPMSALVGYGVVLGGFGCTSDAVNGGGADGKYRIGQNTIVETSDSVARSFGADFYAPLERNNLFTERAGANLCPGDSGGPAFRVVTGPHAGQYANRTIVGMNSRVFYTDTSRAYYSSSLLSATGTVTFADWAKRWAEGNGVDVCGVWGTPSRCR
jgi:hypothetical protein